MASMRDVLVVLWILGNTCTDGSLLDDNFLLVVDGRAGKIHQLSLNGTINNMLAISNQIHPVAVDYDPMLNMIFWTDVGRQTFAPKIVSAMLNGSNEKVVRTLSRSSSPEGLAVDPQLQLVFYSDNGANSINVVRYNGTMEATIVVDADNPRDIKLDIKNRHVYWADWGKGTLERCNYDGSHRMVLYQQEDAWINTLDLDIQGQKVWWTDARFDVVMSADLKDGSNPITVIDGKAISQKDGSSPHFYGIAVDKEYMYLTDWTKSTIFRANRIDGSHYTSIGPDTFTMLNSLHVYESNRHITGGSTPCLQNNGGCGSLCLPIGEQNYKCVCPVGQLLNNDNHTCYVDKTSGPDLIWLEYDGAASSYIRGINGEPRNFIRSSKINSWKIHSPLWHWKAADFNYDSQMLYLVDGFDKYITRLSLNGTLKLQVIHYGLSPSVNGLAFDWLSGSLYWTDGLYNWIRMCKAESNTQNVKTVIRNQMDSPHGIAVYPQKGLMFWTDWGENDKIESATLSGEQRKVLVMSPKPVYSPTGITVDYTNDRLYWCNQHQLMSAKLDGSDVKTLYSNLAVDLAGISLHGSHLIAADRGASGKQAFLLFLNVQSPGVVPKLGLPRWPSDVVMYHKDRQPKIDKPMNCSSCSQLCASESSHKNHTRCLCSDGYKLKSDARSCEKVDTASSPGFIFSLGQKICAIPIEEVHTKQTDPEKLCFFESDKYEFAAMAFDYYNAEIFFSEVKHATKTIRRSSLNDKQNNSVIVYGVGKVYGLAYDYLSGNLYWTDSTLGEIRVSNADGSYQKALISGRNKPRALAINMKSKLLYWSEETPDGTTTRIMSAYLDGMNMSPIVPEGEIKRNVTGLAVDYTSIPERLFWVDNTRKTIEYITFDGSVTEQLPSTNIEDKELYGLAVFEDFIGVTGVDKDSNTGLFVHERATGSKMPSQITYNGYKQAFDIIGFNADNQMDFGGYKNGSCEQLCLQSSSTSCKCACIDGMLLASDQNTCVSTMIMTDDFLMIADDYHHTVHQVDPNNLTSFSSLKLPHLERPIAVAYNPIDGKMFWTDLNTGMIKKAHLDGSNVEVIKPEDTESRIEGLAVEPNSGLVYYTDVKKSLIGVLTMNGKYHKILHQDDVKLKNIRTIVLDVANGYMYYTVKDSTSAARIVRANLDATNPVDIINTSLIQPRGLTIDFTDKKLYWIDSGSQKIEVSDLDGNNRNVVLNLDTKTNPFGIALVGDYIYWTDWLHRGLHYIQKTGNGIKRVVHTHVFPGLNDIIYVNSATITDIGTCKNGGVDVGCSHLCIPTAGKATCVCPDKEDGTKVVPGDGLNCTSPSCSTTIPNGKFSNGCKMTPGSKCTYSCNPPYKATTLSMIQCYPGFEWSIPLENLCSEVSCPLIFPPWYAELDYDASDPRCRTLASSGATPGLTCTYKCAAGYKYSGGHKSKTCTSQNGGTWNGTDILCTSIPSCPALGLPPVHSIVTPLSCKTVKHTEGFKCHYRCNTGYRRTKGDIVRTCTNRQWSGRDIVCEVITKPGTTTTTSTTSTTSTTPPTTTTTTGPTTAPGTNPPVGDTGSVKGNSGKSSSTSIAVGVVLALIVLVVFIIVLAIYMYRRSDKMFAKYRDSTNFDGTSTDDLQPVVSAGDITPSFDVHSEKVHLDGNHAFNNNLYVAQNGHLKQDGSVSFDNPGYKTAREKEEFDAINQYNENEYDEVDDKINKPNPVFPEVEVNVADGPRDRTAFSNPLYENIDEPNLDITDSVTMKES